MARLSPQDIDRLVNTDLDRRLSNHDFVGLFSGVRITPIASGGRVHDKAAPPPLSNSQHGWKPTLEDIERRMH